MPVVLNNNKSAFEITNFDSIPAKINHQGQSITSLKGSAYGVLSDAEIRDVAGAPAGSTVTYKHVRSWTNTGSDNPPPGLYFFVKHPKWIATENSIGIYWTGANYEVYIKDVDFTASAPKGLASVMLAKIVRFCLDNQICDIKMLAAGGRSWQDRDSTTAPPSRWGGYYVWARCGFDMPLTNNPDPSDLDSNLFPFFLQHPANLKGCGTVQDVINLTGGSEWWRVCGNGWFMRFDCSKPTATSVLTLEAYLKEKSL